MNNGLAKLYTHVRSCVFARCVGLRNRLRPTYACSQHWNVPIQEVKNLSHLPLSLLALLLCAPFVKWLRVRNTDSPWYEPPGCVGCDESVVLFWPRLMPSKPYPVHPSPTELLSLATDVSSQSARVSL